MIISTVKSLVRAYVHDINSSILAITNKIVKDLNRKKWFRHFYFMEFKCISISPIISCPVYPIQVRFIMNIFFVPEFLAPYVVLILCSVSPVKMTGACSFC
jgi:hypothetical protein